MATRSLVLAILVLCVCAAQLRPASASVVTTPAMPTGTLQQPTADTREAPTKLSSHGIPHHLHHKSALSLKMAHLQNRTERERPIDRQDRQLDQSVNTARQIPVPDTGNWRLVGRILLDCSRSGDLIGCLKLKAVTSLGRALTSSSPISLLDDISITKDPEAVVEIPSDAPQSETELEAALPRSMEERSTRLDRMLIDRLDAFIRSRSVQVSVPLGMGLVEGRGKKDKKGGYAMVLVAAMAGMYMQMTMGGMAMLSGKALIVAKIALALAAVCLLKKSGGGGGGDGHSQVVYASGDNGGGWHRTLFAAPVATAPTFGSSAQLAYNGADYPGGYAAPEYPSGAGLSALGGSGDAGADQHNLVFAGQTLSVA